MTVALADPAAAKPVCLYEADCDGYICTEYDPDTRRWGGCAFDYIACGLRGEHCPMIW